MLGSVLLVVMGLLIPPTHEARVSFPPGEDDGRIVPPTSYNLGAVAEQLFFGEPFVVALGDSHAEELPARLWYAFKSVSPYDPTSYSNGLSNHPGRLGRSVPISFSRPVDPSTSFEVHEGSGMYYAVPTSRLEEFIDVENVGWASALRITAGNGLLPFEWISDTDFVQIRPLFLGSVDGLQQPSIRINGIEYECSSLIPGRLGVATPFLDAGPTRRIVIQTEQTGSYRSLVYGGCVIQKVDQGGQRLPGAHEVFKASNSFQHEGLVCNCPSGGAKQFTREEMRSDLLARSVSADQQPVLVVMLANQMWGVDEHRAILQQYLVEAIEWFDGVSTEPPLVLFVVSFAHHINGDRAAEMINADLMAQAAYEVCLLNPQASYVSLYALMSRTFPATDEHAGAPVNRAFHHWAVSRGFDRFQFVGTVYDVSWDWLDEALHHLRDAPTAAACATLLRDEMFRYLP